MENFDESVWNRLYHEGKHIAAELQSTIQDCRRWIAIYKSEPDNILSPWEKPVYKYSILDFELNKDLVDEYFSEEDKQKQKRFFANSELELVNFLHQLNVQPSQFTYPWKCDYPL
jgi:hypothetical protein